MHCKCIQNLASCQRPSCTEFAHTSFRIEEDTSWEFERYCIVLCMESSPARLCSTYLNACSKAAVFQNKKLWFNDEIVRWCKTKLASRIRRVCNQATPWQRSWGLHSSTWLGRSWSWAAISNSNRLWTEMSIFNSIPKLSVKWFYLKPIADLHGADTAGVQVRSRDWILTPSSGGKQNQMKGCKLDSHTPSIEQL